jgi:hypothetical protein
LIDDSLFEPVFYSGVIGHFVASVHNIKAIIILPTMSNVTTDFINATKKIHADVRGLLNEVRSIGREVSTICEQTIASSKQQTPDQRTQDADDKQSNNQTKGKIDGGKQEAEPYLETLVRSAKEQLRNAKFWVELFALIGLVAYTYETKRTNDLTDRSITQSQNNFIFDERPYVWPAKIEPLPMKVGENIMANVYSVNYGRTPAIHQRATGRILVAFSGDVMTQADSWFGSFNPKSADFNAGSQVILPPGIPPDVKQYPSHITLQGGKPDNQNAIDVLNGTDSSFAIVGTFLYEDSAGNTYRSDFCMRHLAIGSEAWCPRHNEIH